MCIGQKSKISKIISLQRIARKDKKNFLSEEIERKTIERNRGNAKK